MSFDPTGKSVDQILDYGAPGLQYWEHFLPLYAKAFGTPQGATLTDLYARYDEQRGMDLAEFDTARMELDKAVAEGETRWSAHQSVTQTLPTAWTGATGTEALAMVTSQLRQARDDLDTMRTAATTIREAIDPLRRAVHTKAEHTLGLLESTPDGQRRIAIDGKSPADIDALDATDKWLTTTFRPDVDHKLSAFTAACDAADQTFDSHYRTITTAFAQIIDHPFPQPASTLLPHLDPAPDPNPSAPQPTSTTPPHPAAPAVSTTAPNPPYVSAQPAYPSPRSDGMAPNVSSPPDNSGGPAEPPPSGSPANRAGTPLDTSPAQATPPAEPPAAQAIAPAESTTAPAESTTPPAGSATAPAVSDPAQSDNFTRTLKATLDQLETGLQQGVSTALEKLAALADPTTGLSGDMAATGDPKSGTDQPATPEHAANPEHPADPQPPADPKGSDNSALPTGHLEFDLAGKHFALERTPDGTMSLAITDESGHTQTWTLTLDESGKPTLATDDPAPAKDTPALATDDPTQPHANPAAGDPNPTTPPEPPIGGPQQPELPTPTQSPGCAATPQPGSSPADCPDQVAPPPAAVCDPPGPQPPCGAPDTADPPQPASLPGVSAVCPAAPEAPPESAVPTAPLGEAASPLPGVASEPAPEVHPLDGPDAAVEIPEGGVEIPEIPQLATS